MPAHTRIVPLLALAMSIAPAASAQWGPYPYPYPYPIYRFDPGAAVRLDVEPNEAEVYVDGYYAGIVDDFDGVFQRLSVAPGEHQIELYLAGYRTVRHKVYLQPRRTFKIRQTMEKLGAGEQAERPQPANPPQMQPGGQPPMYPMPGRGPAGRRGPQGPPPQPPPPPDPRGGQILAHGTLAIRVQPADAEVIIDGDPWRGPADQDRLVIDVSEGRHTVEIRKAGYRTYVTEVTIRRGETTPLNVSLRAQEP